MAIISGSDAFYSRLSVEDMLAASSHGLALSGAAYRFFQRENMSRYGAKGYSLYARPQMPLKAVKRPLSVQSVPAVGLS